jgi:hypothetical protein
VSRTTITGRAGERTWGDRLLTSFFNQARNVGFAIRCIPAGGVFTDFRECTPGLLGVVGAKGFAEEFAHGSAVALGQRFGFQGQVGWEADGVNTGGSGWHGAIITE